MTPEGRVNIGISLCPDGALSSGAVPQVSFLRSGDITRLLRHKSADQALPVFPMLYSVCGMAQSYAAFSALCAAQEIKPDASAEQARQAIIDMESLREHVLRIFLDWPSLMNSQKDMAAPSPANAAPAMAFAKRLELALFGKKGGFVFEADTPFMADDLEAAYAIIDEAEALLEAGIFASPLEEWLQLRGMEEVKQWAQTGDTPAADFIARLIDSGNAEIAAIKGEPLNELSSAAFLAWFYEDDEDEALNGLFADQTLFETTHFSRNRDNALIRSLGSTGLLARHLARLVELAKLPRRMRALLAGEEGASRGSLNALTCHNGARFGWASVEAARGRLVHAVELDDSACINRYRILAPTQWNFHGQGIAAHLIGSVLEDSSNDQAQLKRRIDLVVNAVDPCVGYDIAFLTENTNIVQDIGSKMRWGHA